MATSIFGGLFGGSGVAPVTNTPYNTSAINNDLTNLTITDNTTIYNGEIPPSSNITESYVNLEDNTHHLTITVGQSPGIKVKLWRDADYRGNFNPPAFPYSEDTLKSLAYVFQWADANGWTYSPKAKENWEMMYMMRQVE